MSEEKPKEGEAAAEAAPPKSKKKLFIIIGAVVALIVIGVVVMLLMGGKKPDPHAQEEKVVEERQLELTELPIIVVNLSDTASYLKVSLLVEYDATALHRLEKDAHSGGGAEEKGAGSGGGHAGGEGGKESGLPGLLGKREAIIKDAIIRVLSSKSATELLTTDGKEKLKEELVEAINEAAGLDEPVVTGVYFTEFIIQ